MSSELNGNAEAEARRDGSVRWSFALRCAFTASLTYVTRSGRRNIACGLQHYYTRRWRIDIENPMCTVNIIRFEREKTPKPLTKRKAQRSASDPRTAQAQRSAGAGGPVAETTCVEITSRGLRLIAPAPSEPCEKTMRKPGKTERKAQEFLTSEGKAQTRRKVSCYRMCLPVASRATGMGILHARAHEKWDSRVA